MLQSRQGTRWLLIDLALDGSECFSANVFGGAFQLDVDGSFSENRSFVNALLQRSTDTVRLAYEVPVDAQLLELRIGNATSTAEKFVIPVDGLG